MLFQTIWLQAMLFQGSYHGFFQPGIILLIPEFYNNAGEKKQHLIFPNPIFAC